MEQKNNHEVDLLYLLSQLGKVFLKTLRSLTNIIMFLFFFGIKRLHWLLLFLALGLGTGYLVYSKSLKYFSSEMIAQPNGVSSIEMAQYLYDVHLMCEKHNYRGLSEILDLPLETSTKIKDINTFFFIDVNGDNIGDYVDYKNTHNIKDTSTAIIHNRILIRAEVFDNNIFHNLNSSLIYYIRKNQYLQKVNKLRKDQLTTLIEQTDLEIQKLDSLQDIEYYTRIQEDNIKTQGQILFLNEPETKLYYVDKINLLNRRLQYERELELASDPITVIKDFVQLQVEENKTMDYCVRFGIVFLLTGYIALLIRRFWTTIKSYSQKF